MMELSYIMYLCMFIVLLDIILLCVYYSVCSMIYWTNKMVPLTGVGYYNSVP